MSRSPEEETIHFLSDLYAMELQALAQLVTAPKIAGDPEIAADFETHLHETEAQAEMVRDRLEALGGSPSAVKDGIMKLGGKAFLLFARLQPETPGKLLAHAYSYEAMEWAGYAILVAMGEDLGDRVTAEIGRSIQAQERTMMDRLEGRFAAAEEASHRDTPPHDLPDHVRRHLTEAHALESQSIQLLEKAAEIAGDQELSEMYRRHLDETRDQSAAVEAALAAMGADPSAVKDAALRLGGLNWGMFFQAQSDTPAKLLAFAYAVEHLEIAAYELLQRTARRAGDSEIAALCERILAEERAMTERLADSIERSVQVTLAALRT